MWVTLPCPSILTVFDPTRVAFSVIKCFACFSEVSALILLVFNEFVLKCVHYVFPVWFFLVCSVFCLFEIN